MQKFLFLLLVLIVLQLSVSATKEGYYKVVKIIDGDTFYIDFNNNNIPDADEKVRVNGIDTMETRINRGLKYQARDYNLTQEETLGIGFLAKQFAKKELNNKYVKAVYSADVKTDAYNRNLISIYYDCDKKDVCKNYEEEVLKAGLAVVYPYSNLADNLYKYEDIGKLQRHSYEVKKLNLVFYDKKNKKCYDINCPDINTAEYYELINKPVLIFKK